MVPTRSAGPEELERVLRYALAPAGAAQLAPAAQVESFVQYLRSCAIPWTAIVCDVPGGYAGVAFALLPPGRTAIVMTPSPAGPHRPEGRTGGTPVPQAGEQSAALRGLLASLADRRLHYAQALLEPDDASKRSMFRESGFWRLATLQYQERDPSYPWVDPPDADDAEWIHFETRAYPLFASTIAATYRDSRDCPRLTGLRPIDDVIAGHKAMGVFAPELWQLARIDGRQAGCLLLSRLTNGPYVELVYMGVVPELRGRGVGALIIRRALELSRSCGAQKLMLVVDQSNGPARGLYQRFGFRQVATREAYLYQWDR